MHHRLIHAPLAERHQMATIHLQCPKAILLLTNIKVQCTILLRRSKQRLRFNPLSGKQNRHILIRAKASHITHCPLQQEIIKRRIQAARIFTQINHRRIILHISPLKQLPLLHRSHEMLNHLIKKDIRAPLLHILRHNTLQTSTLIYRPHIRAKIIIIQLPQHRVQHSLLHPILALSQHIIQIVKHSGIILPVDCRLILRLMNKRLNHLRTILISNCLLQNRIHHPGSRLWQRLLLHCLHLFPLIFVVHSILLLRICRCGQHKQQHGKY